MQPATATRNHRAAEPTPHRAYQDHARYDPLNRLSQITEGGQFRQFGYDRFGNMWVSNASSGFAGDSFTPATSNWFDANNRLTNDGLSIQHDAAGNLTAIGGFEYAYDAEGMMTEATPSIGSATTYRYDGEGRRVQKQTGTGAVTTFVYSAFGELAAEYTSDGVPEGQPTGTHYLMADHLGSTRLVMGPSGNIISRHDYLPFGEEIGADGTTRTTAMKYVMNDDLTQRFTGKERDAETGLDYFGARYMSAAQGRFTSPDPLLESGNPKNPQSWNRYAYAFNNPLRFVDPNGLCSAPAVNPGETGVCIDLYIAAPRINGIGHGDNRGPAPNNPSATYRQEIQLAINPTDASVRMVKDDPGVSKATVLRIPESPAELMIGRKGESTTTVSPVTTDKDGTGHFAVYNEAVNGLSALPGAPKDTIKTDLKFTFTPDGRVGLDPGGTRTAYPSLEIYRYDAQGRPSTILQVQERNPRDLCCRNQVIPKVVPR